MRKLCLLIFVLCLSVSVFSQGQSDSTEHDKIQTIISLAPNITEIIYALNAQDMLVGRTSYCDYPSEVSEITDVGDLYNPNIELIVSLKPDALICSSIVSEQTINAMKNAGLNVFSIDHQEDIDGTYELITHIGSILDKQDEANELINEMKYQIALLSSMSDSIPEKRSIYYCVGYGEGGDFTATGDTFIHDIIEQAGGVNIASNSSFWMISKEELISKDPWAIVLPTYTYSDPIRDIAYLKNEKPYSHLSAVKNDNIFLVDGNIFDRQGPRIVEAIKVLTTYLYPELNPNE